MSGTIETFLTVLFSILTWALKALIAFVIYMTFVIL